MDNAYGLENGGPGAPVTTSPTTTMPKEQRKLPAWRYDGTKRELHQMLPDETAFSLPQLDLQLGSYTRHAVTNLDHGDDRGRHYFDMGLRLMLSFQHELAAKCFLATLQFCPDAALAHALVALCHAPNYNFKGEAYYKSTCHFEDIQLHDLLCVFPSQHVAERHSAAAVAKMEELKRRGGKTGKQQSHKEQQQQHVTSSHENNTFKINSKEGTPIPITTTAAASAQPTSTTPEALSDAETLLLQAVRILTCNPGVDPSLAELGVGRPYADAMRKAYQKHPNDPEIIYWFVESLMVLNAWQLYEYPSGRPLSPDVVEIRAVLEQGLQQHPHHPGLCHLYVHLMEMSAHPELALEACQTLRKQQHAGHLIHMPTHIDVLVGDYEACVHYNCQALLADRYSMESSPATAGKESFYFAYVCHNWHMAVYGAMLGAMEAKAMELACELNTILNEAMFCEFPSLVPYLEAYSALEVHIMVRFGRWQQILAIPLPDDKRLMLSRTGSLLYARSLAHAMLGNLDQASREADCFDSLRQEYASEAQMRILHNNTVAALLEVDAMMMRGELAYRMGQCEAGLELLRKAVLMQDNLNYDEPWGKMQPIRHALGGLLLEQGHVHEAEAVFRRDLELHPRNPWALVGLIQCLNRKETTNGSAPICCHASSLTISANDEIVSLTEQLRKQRQVKWADYNVTVACECCQHPKTNDDDIQCVL